MSQLWGFCLAASEGSFTAAAQALGLFTSAVWQEVRALERVLKATLLRRRAATAVYRLFRVADRIVAVHPPGKHAFPSRSAPGNTSIDLDERGLLNDVLVIAMGEFGRTPLMGTQGSTDGRNHWQNVMSMALVGGGFRHGQVIGASTKDGGDIQERPVSPGDLAATIYHHMGVPLDATYHDPTGRPRAIVEKGKAIAELL